MPPTSPPPAPSEPGGPLLAYVRGFADALAVQGVVMGSVVARDLVVGAEAVVGAVADRRPQRVAAHADHYWEPGSDPFPEETARGLGRGSARLQRQAVDAARSGRATMAEAMLPLTPDAFPGESAGVLDALGVTWSSPAAALTAGVFGLCGCGSGAELEGDVERLLAAVPAIGERPRGLPELAPGVGGDLYRELLLHLLTDAGLLEHGSSVRGSWRTELGDRWAAALQVSGDA